MVKSKSRRAKKVYFPRWLKRLPEHSFVLPVKAVIPSVEIISPSVDGRTFNPANRQKKQQARLKLACVVRLLRDGIRQGFVLPPYTLRGLIDLMNVTAQRHFEAGFSQQSLYQHKPLLDRLLRFCHRVLIQFITIPEPGSVMTDKELLPS